MTLPIAKSRLRAFPDLRLPILLALAAGHFAGAALGQPPGSPVAANGHLQVIGTRLASEAGKPVQLRGVATHGLQWFWSLYQSGEMLKSAATQWGADIIRITVYIYESGYHDNPEVTPAQFDERIDAIVKTCIQTGTYCIIDWHVHHPGYPGYYLENAKVFFEKMSKKYAGIPNVLYEIANEPNPTGMTKIVDGKETEVVKGHYVEWKEIADYANVIIPIIRKNSPKAVVLVGTPHYSSLGLSAGRDWRDVANAPLAFPNLLYVIHFYAAGHNFHAGVDAAAQVLPLFATEWSAATWAVDSRKDMTKAKPWIDMLNKNGIGWTYWSMAAGTSVFDFYNAATGPAGPWAPDGANVTGTGKLVYDLMNTPADAWATPTALEPAQWSIRSRPGRVLALRGAPGKAAPGASSLVRIVDATGRSVPTPYRPDKALLPLRE